MDIRIDEVRKIVDTLPIGLYAGRRVLTTLDLTAETSYYSPYDDNIVISYPLIAEGLKNATISENYTKETAIRSMVYHEVSHAILTPNDTIIHINTSYYRNNPYKQEENFKIFNIFEDERIETLLANFYLDVDFKKHLYYINGGKNGSDSPSTPLEAFYNLVRFRKDFHGLLPKVDKIIQFAKDINRATGQSGFGGFDFWYVKEYWDYVFSLYEQVKKHFNKDGKSNKGTKNGNSNSNKNANKNGGEEGEGEGNKEDYTSGNNKPTKIIPDFNPKEIFNTALNETFDTKVYETLKAIINQFNHRNNSGNGIKSYSGTINPRNFLNDDYRYFDKKIGVNGNNKFGTLHLNLMLDDSGSYYYNAKDTNKVIQALIEIEKQNKNFTFDVYFVAYNYRKAKNNEERYIKPTGSNRLTSELFDLVRTAQKPNTFNYNIVMYDGLAYNHGTELNFAAYNRNNLTIISDEDNQSAIEKYCPSANKIFVNGDYPQYISENIIKALSKAFR